MGCIRPSSSATDVGTVSSWRTAATRHPNHKLLTPAAYFSGEGWKIIDGEVLTTNPITWACGAGTLASDPEHYKGAYWPLPCNMDPRTRECGKLPSGVSLQAWCPSSRLLGRVQQEAHCSSTRNKTQQHH